jgi:hypothetical protein
MVGVTSCVRGSMGVEEKIERISGEKEDAERLGD